MRAIVGGEVEIVSQGSKVIRVRTIGTAADFLDELGGRAVGAPEFAANRAVVGGEVDVAVEGRAA